MAITMKTEYIYRPSKSSTFRFWQCREQSVRVDHLDFSVSSKGLICLYVNALFSSLMFPMWSLLLLLLSVF